MTTLATRWPISRGQDDKHPSITRSTDRDGVWCKCPQKHSIARLQQWQKVSLLVTNLWLLKFNYLFSSKNFLKLQKRIKYGFIYVFVKWKKKIYAIFLLFGIFLLIFWGYIQTRMTHIWSQTFSIRGEEEASTGSPLVVPADCTKGRVMWTLPNPDTSLSVQFQGLTSSYCFVSRYPQMFANYAVLENGVSTTPYRGTVSFSLS